MRSASIGYALKNKAAGLGTTPADVVNRFLGRTRSLTPGEQAELLGAFLEAAAQPTRQAAAQPARQAPQPARQAGAPTSGNRAPAGGASSARAPARQAGAQTPAQQTGAPPTRSQGDGDFFTTLGRVASGVQQGAGFFTQGAQAISSIASLFGGSTAQNVSRIAGQLGSGGSQVSSMLQSLTGGQVPPLPNAPAAAPAGPATAAGGPATGSGQFDATALLQLLMSNPQIQQALRSAPFGGPQGPAPVELVVPTKRGSRKVSIPLRAVVSTMAELATRSAAELSAGDAGARDGDSEYLVGERGELIVDSLKPESCEALVLHFVRMAGEAERFSKSNTESLDETETWANEAGF